MEVLVKPLECYSW